MDYNGYLATLHDLIKELETHSSIIGTMGLAQQLQDCPLTNDLRVFANQDGEKALVRFALDRLVELQLLTGAEAEINIRQLPQGTNFYSGFFELATYGWMLRHALHFQPQIRFSPPDILTANPCTLEGVFVFYDTAFDIKAFGLAPYLLQIFKQKLLQRG